MCDVFRPLLADIKPQQLTGDAVYVHVERKELTLHSSCTFSKPQCLISNTNLLSFLLHFFRTNKKLKGLIQIQLKYNK